MNKLMIAAVAIAFAAVAQAASYQWKSTAGYVYNTDGTSYAAGTAYLFDANLYSQATLLTALYDANAADASALATAFANITGVSSITHQEMTSGRISAGESITYNKEAAGTTWNAYYAMIVGDNIYISSEKPVTASELSSDVAITMGTQSTVSKNVFDEFGTGYTTAGWYNGVAAVPEPTSALMLLVGLAGLALKRKVA